MFSVFFTNSKSNYGFSGKQQQQSLFLFGNIHPQANEQQLSVQDKTN